jgi:hypothetical protein
MIRLFYDLGFILRNWRYLHAHHALRIELRDWFIDYDRPQPPQVQTTYNINIGDNADAMARIASKQQQPFRWGS